MKARLLALAALAALIGCKDAKEPTEPLSPANPSKIISDGANGGNPDFFFLPPLVKNPVNNPNYQAGHFNSTLQPVLTVEICLLQAAPIDAQGLPVTTDCVAGAPVKKFAAGTVKLQNPPDGQYQVVWNTRESNLDVNKFYRIKVLVQGSAIPFGVADLDPVVNMKELKNVRTGEVIPLNDDSTLPINFRVENGGGPALCGTADLCTSTTVTNNSPTGFQTVTVDGGAGAIAGVKFPNGWLPASGPQSVVVTIAQVDIGGTDPVTGNTLKPCHVGLPLQQFPGCFNFTTTPHLAAIDESGRQFATPVTVAVCYSLQGTGDPREKFAEMYASGPNEPAHALTDADDAGILSPAARNCNTTPVITAAPSKGLTQYASAAWRSLKSGLGSVFGVKTAYGVDLGLGGYLDAFSNVGPALAAEIEPVGPTEITLPGGGNFSPFVRVVGSNHHDGEHQNTIGLAGMTVNFQVASGNGTLAQLGSEVGGATQLSVITNSLLVDVESPVSGGGYAAVNWSVPTAPGNYQLVANGPAVGGPVTFTVTVTPTIAQLRDQAFQAAYAAFRGTGVATTTPQGVVFSEGMVTYSALLGDEFLNSETFPTRIQIDQRSIQADNVSLRGVFRDLQRARASLKFAIDQTPLAGAGAPSPFDLMLGSAYADIFAAENWCSGVPTSQLNAAGVMTYGTQQTTQQILQGAVTTLDDLIAQSVAASNATFRDQARLAKARALLDLNDPAGAAALVVLVPSPAGTVFIPASATDPSQYNGIYNLTSVKRWSVSNQEGGNGLPYRSDGDPRVLWTANGVGFDGVTPFFMQGKYISLGSITPLAPNFEAGLILAESNLRTGNLAAMTANLNAIRAALLLPPLTAPASFAQARDILFKERAYTLWLTGHRLGDMRRLVRDYGLPATQVFPTGDYPKGGVYGTDVNFPIPVDTQFNPGGMACFNRDA